MRHTLGSLVKANAPTKSKPLPEPVCGVWCVFVVWVVLVLVVCVTPQDDTAANMLWLDSSFPTSDPPSSPGVSRGPCPITSGVPGDVRRQHPGAFVKFANIRLGPVNAPLPPPPSPIPPSPPPAPSPPSPPGCTGCGHACHGSCDRCGSELLPGPRALQWRANLAMIYLVVVVSSCVITRHPARGCVVRGGAHSRSIEKAAP